jgi:hypothetical protein
MQTTHIPSICTVSGQDVDSGFVGGYQIFRRNFPDFKSKFMSSLLTPLSSRPRKLKA